MSGRITSRSLCIWTKYIVGLHRPTGVRLLYRDSINVALGPFITLPRTYIVLDSQRAQPQQGTAARLGKEDCAVRGCPDHRAPACVGPCYAATRPQERNNRLDRLPAAWATIFSAVTRRCLLSTWQLDKRNPWPPCCRPALPGCQAHWTQRPITAVQGEWQTPKFRSSCAVDAPRRARQHDQNNGPRLARYIA